MKYIVRLIAFCTLFAAASLCATAQENTVQPDCAANKLTNLSMQIMVSRAKAQVALANLVDACKAWQNSPDNHLFDNKDKSVAFLVPFASWFIIAGWPFYKEVPKNKLDEAQQEALNALKSLISILEQARGPLTQCFINDPKIVDRIISQSVLNEVAITPNTNAIIRMARGFMAGLTEPTKEFWQSLHGEKGVLEVSWDVIKRLYEFPSLLGQNIRTLDDLILVPIMGFIVSVSHESMDH